MRMMGMWEAKGSYVFDGKDCIAICDTDNSDAATYERRAKIMAAGPDLLEALIAAKQEMWLSAKSHWTMADFKNWAVIQQIDAALEKADGKPRTAEAISKAATAA